MTLLADAPARPAPPLDEAVPEPLPPGPASRGDHPRRTRRGRRPSIAKAATLTVVVLGLTAAAIDQRSLFTSVPDTLRHIRAGWGLLALACLGVSIPALAMQQRTLLGVGGRRPSAGYSVATTYAGNAISMTVPVIGSEMSVAYSYRRFSLRGLDPATTVWALLVSGVVSSTAFAALVAGGATASGNPSFAIAGLVTLAGVVAPIGGLLFSLRGTRVRQLLVRVLIVGDRLLQRVRHGQPHADWDEQVERLAALHLRATTLVSSLAWSAVNWGVDLACLAFSLEAVGAPVPWRGLVLAWAAGSGAASLGLTPGGLGVVEAALSLALIGAGVPHVGAVSAVLVYRLISLWGAIAVGWLVVLVTGSGVAADAPEEPLRAAATPATARAI